MRALLVVNTYATTTTEALSEVIVAALRSRLELTVEHTSQRGHAQELAQQAAHENFDVVLALGGDGTVNEIANGLMTCDDVLRRPLLGIIPGGNANVFVRNLGYPADPVEATRQVLAAIDRTSVTPIGLGRVKADDIDRYFLFNAGFGADAAVLSRMEQHRSGTRKASDARYALYAAQELFSRLDRKKPHIKIPDLSIEAFFAMVVNFSPWTYLGARALNPQPAAAQDTQLTVYAPTRLRISDIMRLARTVIAGGDLAALDGVVTAHDTDAVHMRADVPTWLQVDGEALGTVQLAHFSHVPNALRVLA